MRKKNRFSRLEMSNKAHERIGNYHKKRAHTYSDYDQWMKINYHSSVIHKQNRLKRVLTQDERKDVWRNTEYYFYN